MNEENPHKEAIDEIVSRVGVDKAEARHLWDAMGVVYDLLAEDGIVDDFGGMESCRVIPETLEYMRRAANQGPTTI